MISETKLDSSFPTGQFHIHGFSELYRFDRGSFLDDMPSKLISTEMIIWGFFAEIN